MVITQPGFAVVHATPQSCWKAPPGDSSEVELVRIYGPLGQPTVVLGHTHTPIIRQMGGTPKILVNAGSVGLPYDGDPRSSYLVLDGNTAVIRRIEYSVKRELQRLSSSALPHADWTARMLLSSSPQLP